MSRRMFECIGSFPKLLARLCLGVGHFSPAPAVLGEGGGLAWDSEWEQSQKFCKPFLPFRVHSYPQGSNPVAAALGNKEGVGPLVSQWGVRLRKRWNPHSWEVVSCGLSSTGSHSAHSACSAPLVKCSVNWLTPTGQAMYSVIR